MRKLFAVLLATVVFVPVSAMAQYKPNQKPNKPSYNGPVTHPGSNNGGIHSMPGHGTPNHGNNSGYNNGNSNNHGNNSGYNNGNNNHGHPGYNPGNNNHGNNNGYNGGYNPGNNNHGGYNPGHNHGHPGHGHPPVMIPELPQAHRAVSRAFRTVENSYLPIFMSKEDKMRMGRAIGMLNRELNNMLYYVGPRYRDEIRNVARIVENAKFAMFSENDVRAAYRKIQRAENLYNRIADNIFRR